jgi:hypothetical protein
MWLLELCEDTHPRGTLIAEAYCGRNISAKQGGLHISQGNEEDGAIRKVLANQELQRKGDMQGISPFWAIVLADKS